MSRRMYRNAYGEEITDPGIERLGWTADGAGLEGTVYRRLAMNTLIPFCKGVGLDVGSQRCPVTDTAIRIDHDQRFHAYQTIDAVVEQFRNLDYIVASHVVEDFANPVSLIRRWVPSLKMGGYLGLIIPTCERYPKPGQPGCNPAHRYETYPETFLQWAEALPELRIVQHDLCAELRAEWPTMFDTECVYQRVQ